MVFFFIQLFVGWDNNGLQTKSLNVKEFKRKPISRCIIKSLGEKHSCDHFDYYYKRTNEIELKTCHKNNLKLK
jgi:hypothetical protein